MVPAFGWSVGDVVKLIEVSVTVYKAFNDARKNSSRQFQLLTDEFGRFHTCLELLHNLLKEHNKNLYFGHDQFQATLEECHEFLQEYAVLGDRRKSVAKFFKTIGWTNEEQSTITRLRTAVHGHAHVIGLYTDYMNLKSSLEAKAVHKKIAENTQETLIELRRLRMQSTIPVMPFITEEPEGTVAQELRVGSIAEPPAASKLEQIAKELDGFSHLLKSERDAWVSQLQINTGIVVDSETMGEDEVESIDMDITLLQTVLQEVDQKLERARNSSKREYNQHVVRRTTHDSGISDMSTSPNSRYNQHFPTSPIIQAPSGVPVVRQTSRLSFDGASPILEDHRASLQRQLSTSPLNSPFLQSSPPTSYAGTAAGTAATTPMFTSPGSNPDTGTRPPSIRLPPAATDWSLFCNDAQVTCEGWQRPWSCKISQRRRTRDCGLSLRAERANGSYLDHEIPAFGVALPHTSHTGANPQAKNVVTFLEANAHKLKKVTRQGESPEREPKYIFGNAADHKAFQELIYGCDLEESWDIVSIGSDREKECVTQTLRLWRDTHTRIPLILFYTNSRRRSAKTYIQEPKTSFTDKVKADKKKPTLQLSFSNQKLDRRPERSSSVSSGTSSVWSERSARTSAERTPSLQWIVIEFADLMDRDKFLSRWQS